MGTTLTIIGIIGGVIGLVGIVAGGVVLARAAYARAQLEQQRGYITDVTGRNEFLETENNRLTSEKKAAEAERDIAVEMVTQRADLEAHHNEVMKNHTRLFGVLDLIKTLLEEVLKRVTK